MATETPRLPSSPVRGPRIEINWELVDESNTGHPFGLDADGQPVFFGDDENHIMVTGHTGSGKTVFAQTVAYSALTRGNDLYVIDVVKGGSDYGFARPHATAIATTADEALVALEHVYAEVRARKQVNIDHGVGSSDDLPNSILPTAIVVVGDELPSIFHPQAEPVEGRARIGVLLGKIARESRAVKVHHVLTAQQLHPDALAAMPGLGKHDMSRLVTGESTFSDQLSAFRDAASVPDLGDRVPRGRGLYETCTVDARIVQMWFEPRQGLLAEKLAERVLPRPGEDTLDLGTAAGDR